MINVKFVTRQIIKIHCNITASKIKYRIIYKVMTSDGELPERPDELFAKLCWHKMSHSEMPCWKRIYSGSLSDTLQTCLGTEKSSPVLVSSLLGSLDKMVVHYSTGLAQPQGHAHPTTKSALLSQLSS